MRLRTASLMLCKHIALGAFLLGCVSIGVAACVDDSCKNPKRIGAPDPVTGIVTSGPAIQCHAAFVCPTKGGGYDTKTPLVGLEDPVIVDRGSQRRNVDGCRQRILSRAIEAGCKAEASPELICLDANGPAGGPGPNPPGGTTIVTVGAASGDYHINGTGGFSATPPGTGGQGGP